MGLTMTNNGPTGLTLSKKWDLSGNLHLILNHQVNYNAFQQSNIPRHIIKQVIAMKNTDQQKPNNVEFDHCDDNTSSDSSNHRNSALEKEIFDERGDDNPPEEESNQSINSTHGENQLSIQRINALQPPGHYLEQKLNYWTS